ncbi:YHS domain-containing (seleno)protein [Fibrobacterota bacterium]
MALKSKYTTSLVLILLAWTFTGIVYLVIWDVKASANKKNRIAIQGFDIMAFYGEGEAKKGSAEFEHQWNDCVWRFTNALNRDKFAANPDAYAPQYGGNCAFTTSLGKCQMGLAKYWQIRDNKLYLNANLVSHYLWKFFPSRSEIADKHWIKLTGKSK